ncbi:matrix-remodeling-associated protein 7-like isoform X3 [Betta splendens]|uniref:Matrix-remodeling-associated protein 7-like isoform X3 n=1 Tax=Betta splendens TaxID=158456 RepID=A0A6P7LA12_BETSP|nr:matrix-remodeling-associated protein 7-like isoform X3 [Betta splendens]
MDLTFVISAIILTLLAIVVATSLLSDSSSTADFPDARSHVGHRGDGASERSERCGPTQNGHVPDKKEAAVDDWCEISGSSHDHWDVVKSVLSTEGATESPEVQDDAQSNELHSLKYVPGKARSHHLQMMLSKEELEEEQRVQREQLSTIFQLLKENKETFGDVSEGDMEEQLRLYSI